MNVNPSSRLARRAALGLVVLAALLPAAPSASALPPKPMFEVNVDGVGSDLGLGVSIDLHASEQALGVCWNFTPGPPVGTFGLGGDGGLVVDFPSVWLGGDNPFGLPLPVGTGNQETGVSNSCHGHLP